MPGAPSSASTHRPESSASAGWPLAIGGGARLEFGIGGEGGAGLFRLGQTQLAGADRLDAVRAEQRLDLAHLAGIVAGDDQRCCRAAASSPSACFCSVDQFADALARQAQQLRRIARR